MKETQALLLVLSAQGRSTSTNDLLKILSSVLHKTDIVDHVEISPVTHTILARNFIQFSDSRAVVDQKNKIIDKIIEKFREKYGKFVVIIKAIGSVEEFGV